MNLSKPHYLLAVDCNRNQPGEWAFSLRRDDGAKFAEARDIEPATRGPRLELLTVIRGLESLDGPARVTLVGCSSQMRHGMQQGLPQWRDSGWQWESYGELAPVRNADLWQRFDRALRFHEIRCTHYRFDGPHHGIAEKPTISDARDVWGLRAKCTHWVTSAACGAWHYAAAWLALRMRKWTRLGHWVRLGQRSLRGAEPCWRLG